MQVPLCKRDASYGGHLWALELRFRGSCYSCGRNLHQCFTCHGMQNLNAFRRLVSGLNLCLASLEVFMKLHSCSNVPYRFARSQNCARLCASRVKTLLLMWQPSTTVVYTDRCQISSSLSLHLTFLLRFRFGRNRFDCNSLTDL